MKRIVLIFSLPLMLAAACNEQNTQEENSDLLSTDLVKNPRSAAGLDSTELQSLATMDFKDTVKDFGTVKDGETVTMEYEFTNNGKTPLIISNASGSCGCTVADFPKEPLQPGHSSSVKVQFSSAGKVGHQEKSVSLTTNSVRGQHNLYIKGEVVK